MTAYLTLVVGPEPQPCLSGRAWDLVAEITNAVSPEDAAVRAANEFRFELYASGLYVWVSDEDGVCVQYHVNHEGQVSPVEEE